jgi:hypothetical protein
MAPLKLVFAIAVAISLGMGGVDAAPVGFLETGPKSLLVERNQSPVGYRQYDEYPERDDDADLFAPEESEPPAPPLPHRHPPAPAIYAPVYDRGLALLELDRLRAVAHRQPNCPEHVLAPPRTYPLLQSNKFLASCFAAKPPRDRDDKVRVLG